MCGFEELWNKPPVEEALELATPVRRLEFSVQKISEAQLSDGVRPVNINLGHHQCRRFAHSPLGQNHVDCRLATPEAVAEHGRII